MNITGVFAMLLVLVAAGCAPMLAPKTPAEQVSGFTYIPIDPFPIHAKAPPEGERYSDEMTSLPDNSVRIMIQQIDTAGNVTFGAGSILHKNERLRIVIDYINSDTTNAYFIIGEKYTNEPAANAARLNVTLVQINAGVVPGDPERQTVKKGHIKLYRKIIVRKYPGMPSEDQIATFKRANSLSDEDRLESICIPLYIGIGFRITSDVMVNSDTASLTGFASIGAQASLNNISGTLTVQTLGINGEMVHAALPVQTDLSKDTLQSIIAKIESLKTVLYTKDKFKLEPRLVGMYIPIRADQQLINSIESEIISSMDEWNRHTE